MARMIAERGDVIPQLAEIFRLYGFEGTSIARITEHTGLGKGSLYHFFPGGKAEMAQAVLDEINDWFEQEIFTPLGQQEPKLALRDMVTNVDRYFQSGRRICLLGAFALEETRHHFGKSIRQYFTQWLTCLADALQRDGMGASQAYHMAQHIVATIQGGIILTHAFDDTARFTELLDNIRRDLALD